MKFLSIVIGGPIIECYGLSETGPVTCTEAFDNTFGHMGGPLFSILKPQFKLILGMEFKVIDVPEMKYFSSHI